jgi:hypothetical protein
LQWNNIGGMGIPNVVIDAHPAWQPGSPVADWVSYEDTGEGEHSIAIRNTGAFGALGAFPAAVFFHIFHLPYGTNKGGLRVWADDTASVSVDDRLLFAASVAPAAVHCVSGTIGCAPGAGGYVDLSGLRAGQHMLRLEAYQLGGGPFGVMYAGSIESVPESAPEPATYALIGAGLLGLAAWRRRAPRCSR